MTRSRAPHAAPTSRLSASQAPPRPTTRPDPGTALTEPLSAPPVMSPDEAAWVRANAWTAEMRANNPAWRSECLCQRSTPCRHDRCRADSGPLHETSICDRTGVRVLADAEHARVWLADRACRWRCGCRCHAMRPRPASAMTEAEAAWIREHAWTTPMRKGYIETPGFYTHCACQWTGPCENDPRPGVHDRCHVGRIPMPQYETVITTRNERIAYLREPYRHPTASATGWHHTAVAQVWLARHHCRWTCVCPQDCGHPRADIAHAPELNPARAAASPAAPEPARAVPAPRPTYEQDALFDLTEVSA